MVLQYNEFIVQCYEAVQTVANVSGTIIIPYTMVASNMPYYYMMIIFPKVLHQSCNVSDTYGCRSGRYLANRFFGRSFQTSTRRVNIAKNGIREVEAHIQLFDFDLLDFHVRKIVYLALSPMYMYTTALRQGCWRDGKSIIRINYDNN